MLKFPKSITGRQCEPSSSVFKLLNYLRQPKTFCGRKKQSASMSTSIFLKGQSLFAWPQEVAWAS